MKIGIDGYEANVDRRVGIGQYAYHLIKQLYDLDKENDYTIFLPSPPRPDLPGERSNWRYIVGKAGGLWTIRELPRIIKSVELDVFFSPTHYGPWFTKLPLCLSVMDLSYLHYPDMFRFKDLLQLKYMGWYSIKRAQKIFTISEYSKKEIVKHYNYPERDIVVTYPGFMSVKREALSVKKIFEKYHVNKPYILFVGTIQPRKNIKRLIEAFDSFDTDHELVLAGKPGWLYEPLYEQAKKSPKRDKIKFLNFLPDQDLPVLYQNASCFVLPSLYEGFGIPVVDALSFGCPVVVSNTSSLPEVAGKAGIYVDPLNTRSIAEGMMKALQLSKSERERLVKLGREHIKQFSWENCGKKTLETLVEITSP